MDYPINRIEKLLFIRSKLFECFFDSLLIRFRLSLIYTNITKYYYD